MALSVTLIITVQDKQGSSLPQTQFSLISLNQANDCSKLGLDFCIAPVNHLLNLLICFGILTLARTSTLWSILFIWRSSSDVNLFNKGSSWPVCTTNTQNIESFGICCQSHFCQDKTANYISLRQAGPGLGGWGCEQRECIYQFEKGHRTKWQSFSTAFNSELAT